MIPFKVQPLTKATNPVKVYEYFSQGKPVVSVNLPELKMLEPLCYIANSPEEFLKQLQYALGENDEKLASDRMSFAAANQWSSRYAQLELCLNKLKNSKT